MIVKQVVVEQPPPLTWLDYLDDFTEFLSQFAGWGVVAIIVVSLLVMLLRSRVLSVPMTRLQQVTAELFLAFNMLIWRNIILAYVLHRRDLPQPWRVIFWLFVFTLCWRFFYFALWKTWLRPGCVGGWNYVIRPRLRRIRDLVKFFHESG